MGDGYRDLRADSQEDRKHRAGRWEGRRTERTMWKNEVEEVWGNEMSAGDSQSSPFLHQDYGSFLRCKWIPFLDFITIRDTGSGILLGSGNSSKRSSVRATATFSSFIANCFPMQFLCQEEIVT